MFSRIFNTFLFAKQCPLPNQLFVLMILLYLSVNVHMPKDRITQQHQGYGFVEFMGEDDADYSIKIMNMIKMYGKPIRVNKVSTYLILIDFDILCFLCAIFLLFTITILQTTNYC